MPSQIQKETMLSIETILLIIALLLFLSVAASKVSDRFGVPTLFLFLTIGMFAGSDGIGGIYFNDPWLTKNLGTIALSFILFSVGFEMDKKDIKDVFLSGLSLSTIGVLLTALFPWAYLRHFSLNFLCWKDCFWVPSYLRQTHLLCLIF